MDPTITLLNIIDPDSGNPQSKKESRAALKEWYAKGGFHPTFKNIVDLIGNKPWFKFIKVGYLMDLGIIE